MTNLEHIGALGVRLERSLGAEDWAGADRVRNALKRLFLRGVVASASEEIEAVSEVVGRTRAGFALKRQIRPRDDDRTMESKLQADAETFVLGCELRPAHAPLDQPARNATEAVAAALAKANRPMTNQELATRLGYAHETVTRALTELKRTRRVVSVRAGRDSLNSIVAAHSRKAWHPLDVLKQSPDDRTVIGDDRRREVPGGFDVALRAKPDSFEDMMAEGDFLGATLRPTTATYAAALRNFQAL